MMSFSLILKACESFRIHGHSLQYGFGSAGDFSLSKVWGRCGVEHSRDGDLFLLQRGI